MGGFVWKCDLEVSGQLRRGAGRCAGTWDEESVSKVSMNSLGQGQAGSQGATWCQAAVLGMAVPSDVAGTS